MTGSALRGFIYIPGKGKMPRRAEIVAQTLGFSHPNCRIDTGEKSKRSNAGVRDTGGARLCGVLGKRMGTKRGLLVLTGIGIVRDFAHKATKTHGATEHYLTLF